jgi:hypothetical protein
MGLVEAWKELLKGNRVGLKGWKDLYFYMPYIHSTGSREVHIVMGELEFTIDMNMYKDSIFVLIE